MDSLLARARTLGFLRESDDNGSEGDGDGDGDNGGAADALGEWGTRGPSPPPSPLASITTVTIASLGGGAEPPWRDAAMRGHTLRVPAVCAGMKPARKRLPCVRAYVRCV